MSNKNSFAERNKGELLRIKSSKQGRRKLARDYHLRGKIVTSWEFLTAEPYDVCAVITMYLHHVPRKRPTVKRRILGSPHNYRRIWRNVSIEISTSGVDGGHTARSSENIYVLCGELFVCKIVEKKFLRSEIQQRRK